MFYNLIFLFAGSMRCVETVLRVDFHSTNLKIVNQYIVSSLANNNMRWNSKYMEKYCLKCWWRGKNAAKLDKQATQYVSEKFELNSLMLCALQVGTILNNPQPTLHGHKATTHSAFHRHTHTHGYDAVIIKKETLLEFLTTVKIIWTHETKTW